MSLTGTALYLPILLLRSVTRRLFSASWHDGACLVIVLFLLVPVCAVSGPAFSSYLNSAGGELQQLSSALTEMFSAPEAAAEPANDSGYRAASPVQPVSDYPVDGFPPSPAPPGSLNSLCHTRYGFMPAHALYLRQLVFNRQ